MVNKPLIRPYFWGGVRLGGVGWPAIMEGDGTVKVNFANFFAKGLGNTICWASSFRFGIQKKPNNKIRRKLMCCVGQKKWHLNVLKSSKTLVNFYNLGSCFGLKLKLGKLSGQATTVLLPDSYSHHDNYRSWRVLKLADENEQMSWTTLR